MALDGGAEGVQLGEDGIVARELLGERRQLLINRACPGHHAVSHESMKAPICCRIENFRGFSLKIEDLEEEEEERKGRREDRRR